VSRRPRASLEVERGDRGHTPRPVQANAPSPSANGAKRRLDEVSNRDKYRNLSRTPALGDGRLSIPCWPNPSRIRPFRTPALPTQSRNLPPRLSKTVRHTSAAISPLAEGCPDGSSSCVTPLGDPACRPAVERTAMRVICAWCEAEGRPAVLREKEPLEDQETFVSWATRVKRY
jgi:hypothetical protein